MRKSSSPSLSNCNSVLANKIFGIPLDELQQGGHPDNEVPFIVRHVVDYIEEHGGLEQEGLFQVNGNAETVEWLRQRYDNGEDVDLVKEADVPSAISLLRFFLQELPEPVIPGSLHIHLMQLSQDYNNEDEFGRKLRFLLQQLPPVNYSLLKFLCRFLANVASHHEEIWSANSLAAVFGPDVFHIYTDVEDLKEQEIVSRIMAGLLENYYEFFENEEEDFSSTNDLSSLTEQINELSEEEEEDEKLEQSEELPEDCAEKSKEMPEVVHLRMTENILESNSVKASTSAHISPINILPASADILERTIRAAVEQHLFNLQSGIDHDLKSLQQRGVGHNKEAKSTDCDGEGADDQDVIAGDINASESNRGCSETLASTNLENEAIQPDFAFENEENDQSLGILLEPCIEHSDDEDEGVQRNECVPLDDSGKNSQLALDSSSKICDLNANTESEVPGGESGGGVHGEAACLHIPHLELKSVSDGDKWEEPFPAFKSWQEDSESGEAQLSPQAGRMTHHPLEEDCPPVLSHRSLDFGQSQRFLHDPETLDSSSKALSFARTRRASFSSKDDKREDKTPYQLVKKLQKKIRQFEEQFEKEKNSKVTREERHIVKPLYDRYRLVKQMLTRASITPILGSPSTKRRGQMLQPIIEGETAHFFEEIKEEEEDGVNLSSELNDILKTATQTQTFSSSLENSESDVEESQEKLALDLRLSSTRAASMPELLEQLWKARAEKKKLRKTLREFEEAFYQQNGRNAQKEDRTPMLEEYREYKKIKAKLRLLEVLISKQDSSKSI
ncbi:protein FAM13B isoform X2 [Trichosurus vulpecula]|uniref:protein FAM13B isoform X2 n=1 Tax=Trichosurus vulpecula TaxID=9337 RepID=UPI00186ABC21|nr:protein FAM13B isoform X2 [Trichosurus vulpecula]